jgi:hypothetical protein
VVKSWVDRGVGSFYLHHGRHLSIAMKVRAGLCSTDLPKFEFGVLVAHRIKTQGRMILQRGKHGKLSGQGHGTPTQKRIVPESKDTVYLLLLTVGVARSFRRISSVARISRAVPNVTTLIPSAEPYKTLVARLIKSHETGRKPTVPSSWPLCTCWLFYVGQEPRKNATSCSFGREEFNNSDKIHHFFLILH